MLPKKNPTPQARTCVLRSAWRTCFQRVRPPSVVPALSTLSRSMATDFSSLLRNLAVSGPRGIIHHARPAMNSEIRPCQISNEITCGKAPHLEEEDISPGMDEAPRGNAAQANGEQTTKCAAGARRRDVNAGPEPEFLSPVTILVSCRTWNDDIHTIEKASIQDPARCRPRHSRGGIGQHRAHVDFQPPRCRW